MGTCEICGRSPAKRMTFKAHQGFLVFRRETELSGVFCRDHTLEAYAAARGGHPQGYVVQPLFNCSRYGPVALGLSKTDGPPRRGEGRSVGCSFRRLPALPRQECRLCWESQLRTVLSGIHDRFLREVWNRSHSARVPFGEGQTGLSEL